MGMLYVSVPCIHVYNYMYMHVYNVHVTVYMYVKSVLFDFQMLKIKHMFFSQKLTKKNWYVHEYMYSTCMWGNFYLFCTMADENQKDFRVT